MRRFQSIRVLSAAFLILSIIAGILTNWVPIDWMPAWMKDWRILLSAVVMITIIMVWINLKMERISSSIANESESMNERATYGIFAPQTRKPRNDEFAVPKINPLPDKVHGKIAFLRNKQNNREYVIANSDGSNEFMVAQTSWSLYGPRIAPGGERVVFVSAYEGRESVYIINRDGTNLKRLTGPGNAKSDGYASWSLDASELLYLRKYSVSSDICLMDSNGDNQKNLTNTGILGERSFNWFSEFPWSPDNQKIVFWSDRNGYLKIYTMDRNGENVRQVTTTPEARDYGAVWAPDGNRIAYVSTAGVNGQADIFILDLEDPALEPINITNNPNHDTDPIWSPDGTQILFISTRDGNRELYVMNSDGSHVRRITYSAENKDNPSWLR